MPLNCSAGSDYYATHGLQNNKEFLNQISPKISLETKRLSCFGHVRRVDSLKRSIMLGVIIKKRRGCPGTYCLDTINDDTKLTMVDLKEAV